MKTIFAALAHIGVTALQTAAAVQYFDNSEASGALGNTGIQIGAQMGLAALQAYLAKKNSHTDPKGQPLREKLDGGFVSEPKPEKPAGQ